MRCLRCDQLDDFAAVFHASAHGPARIDRVAFARDFFAPADLGGDLGRDQENRPRDGAAFLDAHLAEVFAVHELLRAIGRHRKLVQIFQRHIFLGQTLASGFFQSAFFVAAFLGAGTRSACLGFPWSPSALARSSCSRQKQSNNMSNAGKSSFCEIKLARKQGSKVGPFGDIDEIDRPRGIDYLTQTHFDASCLSARPKAIRLGKVPWPRDRANAGDRGGDGFRSDFHRKSLTHQLRRSSQ